MKTMKCQGCNAEIIRKTNNQKWCLKCSYDQRKDHKALSNKECPLCLEKFIPHNGQQKYCSQACIKKSKNIRSNSRWNKEPKKSRPRPFGYKELIVI